MQQADIDPLDRFEAAGLGGPARIDLHMVAGDGFSFFADFDQLPVGTDAKLQCRGYKDDAASVPPLVELTVTGGGVVVDSPGRRVTFTFTAAQVSTLDAYTGYVVYGVSVKPPGLEAETYLVGVVNVTPKVVTWP